MVNCNPETVSTDYDTSDRLYFEPLTLEDVLEIIGTSRSRQGVIVQFGGQTPLKLARAAGGEPACRSSARARIRSTSPRTASASSSCSTKLGLRQPPNRTARDRGARPSARARSRLPAGRAAVLRARRPRDGNRLRARTTCARTCARPSRSRTTVPVLLDRFLDVAIEVDVDAICDGKDVLIGGIMEHIEQAGVHSGDSGCSLPPATPVAGDPGRAARPDPQAGAWR